MCQWKSGHWLAVHACVGVTREGAECERETLSLSYINKPDRGGRPWVGWVGFVGVWKKGWMEKGNADGGKSCTDRWILHMCSCRTSVCVLLPVSVA